MTLRALEVLKNADCILCEDTRVTGKLLAHYAVTTPTMSYHQHSGAGKVREIGEMLAAGKHLVLVTDAGTPGVSDPGNRLIAELRGQIPELSVAAVPGASAVVAALSISGFPTDKFLFLGFPPHKNKRQKFFQEVAASKYTVAFYESSHRIKKCLEELRGVLGSERQVCVCRELTKKFESVYRGTIEELIGMRIPEKGEFVVIVNGN